MGNKPYRSQNQRELMGIILQKAGEGVFLNMKQLHAEITYGSSYGAVRSSLRFLVAGEMIETKKTGVFTLIIPTQKGYDWFRPLRS
jgi:hypothetical protein